MRFEKVDTFECFLEFYITSGGHDDVRRRPSAATRCFGTVKSKILSETTCEVLVIGQRVFNGHRRENVGNT